MPPPAQSFPRALPRTPNQSSWAPRQRNPSASARKGGGRHGGEGRGGGGAGPRGCTGPGGDRGRGPGAGPDWANLPADLLAKVAETLVAQTEAGWAARLKWLDPIYWTEARIQEKMAERKRNGNCLFVFARVCRGWRKAKLKVGAPLCTRVESDVLLPGSVALAKWALVEGCPRKRGDGFTMALAAARYGHAELVKWLCGEGGFAMDEYVMAMAAYGGNLRVVQWLRGKGCPWDFYTCYWAVHKGHVEVLRWARENGCPWDTSTRNQAAQLGYTDNLGNLDGAYVGNPVQSDDEYEYEYSSYSDDEYSSE